MSIRIFVKIQKNIHNAPMSDRHQSPSYPLRLPVDLKTQVARAAATMGRSFNSEVAARLQTSFEPADYTALPFAVVQAVEAAMEAGGLTQAEALTQLVLVGQSQGGTVLHLHIAPGTTAKDVHTALTAALKLIPPDSILIAAQG